MDRNDLEDTYLAPFIDRIKEGFDYFETLKSSEWSIKSFDGLTLRADYYPHHSQKTAILVHGFGATALNNFCILGPDLYEKGYNLLLVHQRAHTGSEGSHSTFGAREKYDILKWIDEVASDKDIESIVIGGVSTGAATVALSSALIKNPKVKALIIDCGFKDAYSQLYDNCLQRKLPGKLLMPLIWFWSKLFLRADLKKESATEALRQNVIPSIFIHGTEDDTVEFSHGVINYEACAAPKMKLFLDGGNHSSTYLFGGQQAKDVLMSFLEQYIPI